MAAPLSEAQIQHDIRLAVGSLPGVVIWRNSTGVDTRTKVRYGLCNGSADLIGIVHPPGRFIALEVKTNRGQPTTQQRQFLRLVNRMGGYGAVVRSVEEAMLAVERARRSNGLTIPDDDASV